MSVSGSAQETKTALLEVSDDGTQTEGSIDAQEDREIIGVLVTASLASNDPNIGSIQASLVIGTNPFESPTGTDTNLRDNLSWSAQFRFGLKNDNTNGNAVLDEGPYSEWFGVGEGFEWNEDVTLTLRVNGHANLSRVEAMVYYREV